MTAIPHSLTGLFLCALLLPVQGATPTYVNQADMQFVLVKAGTFLMGSHDRERGASPSEQPQHQTRISNDFYIGKYEVTQSQWAAVMRSDPYAGKRSNPFFDMPGMAARVRRPENPVTVSWDEAQAFIERLNQMEGQALYRLPSEAQWEYAARAGTATAYSFGDDDRQLGRYAWHGEDFATGSPHPVGKKLPNPWGLHDIHGNVWEWVQDYYAPAYQPGSAADPTGPASGTGRVVRGGSWHTTSGSWRSAFRKEYAQQYRGISIGFRLVRMVSP